MIPVRIFLKLFSINKHLMHYMIVSGGLEYGADASASQVARPKCRVCD